MSSTQKRIILNEDMLAVHQDRLGEAGGRVGFANCSEGPEVCQIWRRNVTDGVVIATYNSGQKVHDINFNVSHVGMESVAKKIRDLWHHVDLGTFTGLFTAKAVPSHGTSVSQVKVPGQFLNQDPINFLTSSRVISCPISFYFLQFL